MSETSSSYAFDLISDLIDYRGDIKRNKKTGNIHYSNDFSPNNIRRLILSGDGAKIYFHVSVDGRLSKTKVFSNVDKIKLNEIINREDYKPMIWTLADRVCSSIEEVIICSKNSAGINLYKELNVSGLVKGNSGVSDITKLVLDRYKRLAYFTIVNCDIQTLVMNDEIRSCDNKSMRMLSETNFIKNIGNVNKFRDDWYNNYGTTSAYSFDNQGSKLNLHFKKIKSDVEESKKQQGIDKIRKERIGELTDKFDKAYKNYVGIFRCTRMLYGIVKPNNTNYIARGIASVPILGNSPENIRGTFTENPSESIINSMISDYTYTYSLLCEWFLKELCSINKKYPITVKVLLNEMDRCIAVPQNCNTYLDELGVIFDGKSIMDSISNICSYSCTMFISSDSSYSMDKYCKKDIWMKNFDISK